MNKKLIIRLVIPLVLATGVAIAIHLYWPADGFFLNIAAGFVGSLIIIVYIDWILKRHEDERWKETDTRITFRLQRLTSSTITGIRSSFGYGTDVFQKHALKSGSADLMRKEVLRIARDLLIPTAELRIAALDTEGWRRLIAHLQALCALVRDGVGADPNLSHRADPILSQGRKPTLWSLAVDKFRSWPGSLTSSMVVLIARGRRAGRSP